MSDPATTAKYTLFIIAAPTQDAAQQRPLCFRIPRRAGLWLPFVADSAGQSEALGMQQLLQVLVRGRRISMRLECGAGPALAETADLVGIVEDLGQRHRRLDDPQ